MKLRILRTNSWLSLLPVGVALSATLACGSKKNEDRPAANTEASSRPSTPATETEPEATAQETAKPEPVGIDAAAAPPQDLSAITLEDAEYGTDVEKALEAEVVLAHGVEYPAAKYCNDDTTSNPGDLEVYSVSNNAKLLVYLCPGSLDGVPNVVSVFEEGKEPLTKTVTPAESTHRIEQDVLLATVKELLESR